MKQWVNFFSMLLVATFATGMQSKAQEAKPKKDAKAEIKPVKIEDGVARLNADNTSIEFIGTHVGDDPKPRLGGFTKFEGEIKIENNQVAAISVEIAIGSVWTEFDGLTKHLKTPDFFEIDKYATSSFKSTKISVNDKGLRMVTGELTFHGTTKEISFPVKTEIDESGLLLGSKFKLDRTVFGMDKMTSGVEKVVSMQIFVGRKTQPKESVSGSGSGKKKKKEEKKTSAKTPTLHVVSLKLPNMI